MVRSYIFTSRERKAIERFLAGQLPRNDPVLEQLRSRMRHFDLSGDIELYLKLRKSVAAASA
jgi:hypothetical protein